MFLTAFCVEPTRSESHIRIIISGWCWSVCEQLLLERGNPEQLRTGAHRSSRWIEPLDSGFWVCLFLIDPGFGFAFFLLILDFDFDFDFLYCEKSILCCAYTTYTVSIQYLTLYYTYLMPTPSLTVLFSHCLNFLGLMGNLYRLPLILGDYFFLYRDPF